MFERSSAPMSWRALTEDDLKTRLSETELLVFRNTAKQPGGKDPIQGVLDQITDTVRGYIAGSANNQLGANGTIPLKLIGCAVALSVMEVMARSGGKVLDLGGHRKDSARDSMSLLKDVAADRFKIDVPAVLTSEVSGFIPPTFNSNRTRQFGYGCEAGI